jgi:hypothetical protein
MTGERGADLTPAAITTRRLRPRGALNYQNGDQARSDAPFIDPRRFMRHGETVGTAGDGFFKQ